MRASFRSLIFRVLYLKTPCNIHSPPRPILTWPNPLTLQAPHRPSGPHKRCILCPLAAHKRCIHYKSLPLLCLHLYTLPTLPSDSCPPLFWDPQHPSTQGASTWHATHRSPHDLDARLLHPIFLSPPPPGHEDARRPSLRAL